MSWIPVIVSVVTVAAIQAAAYRSRKRMIAPLDKWLERMQAEQSASRAALLRPYCPRCPHCKQERQQ